jgi:biopolymer transport protein ExbB
VLEAYLADLRVLMAAGGSTMPALVLCACAMWFALGWRLFAVRRGDARSVDVLWREACTGRVRGGRGVLDTAVARLAAERVELHDLTPEQRSETVQILTADLADDLGSLRSLASSLVVSAPLLGLLGTVSGMIETFDALAEQAMFRQGGGIAGGISEALITTEVGLCIAIPGTIVARLIDRREARIRADLATLEALAERGEGMPCAA